MKFNLILAVDTYKASHFKVYPPGIEGAMSYFVGRSRSYPTQCFFGLQYILQEFLSRPITAADIAEAGEAFAAHGQPFNQEGWDHILEHHNGFLPLEIRAVPEGTLVPANNVLFTVESTDPKCAWLVSYVETILSRVWAPTTVATQGLALQELIRKHLMRSSDNVEEELPFKLHDFGSRGASSRESAAICGAAHLLHFQGTDTADALMFLREYYGARMAGFSIPASEHSVITSWGEKNELGAQRAMLQEFGKPGAVFASVCDSYDLADCLKRIWGSALRDEVIASGATVVLRPDSGKPVETVRKCLYELANTFGVTFNSKGYRVLNHVRVIQGDGVHYGTIEAILEDMNKMGFSATNIAFGMGGARLQKIHRDQLSMAYKTCLVQIGGDKLPVFKNPVDDVGKKSLGGFLDLVRHPDGSLETIDRLTDRRVVPSALVRVFKDGLILQRWTLDEIRARANDILSQIPTMHEAKYGRQS